MEWYVVAIGMMALLMVLIGIGLPIPFAMIAASLPFLWHVQSFQASLVAAELMTWSTWTNFTLLAVPLFVLLGELIGQSMIGPRLYEALHRGVPVRGSAAYGSVVACAGFGAVSGTSMIGALTIGTVAMPEMIRLGYDRRLASGLVAAGGTLSVMIPPSMILIYYGVITETSIGKLFLAGVVPGLIQAAMFIVTILIWRILRPADVGKPSQGHWSIVETAVAAFPIVLIAALIMGSIYAGIATATEAAAVAVVAMIVLAFTVGRMSWAGFMRAILGTIRAMGYVGVLVSAALLMGFTLNYYRVPHELTAFFVSLGLDSYATLAAVIVFYLVIGMFLEPASITFITLPTLYPLIAASGFDLIWFAIIYVIIMEIAVLTPPVGLNLYVIQGLAPRELTVMDVVIGSMPFVLTLCALTLVLIAFPQLALWLPAAVR